jgi:hypothetical protein
MQQGFEVVATDIEHLVVVFKGSIEVFGGKHAAGGAVGLRGGSKRLQMGVASTCNPIVENAHQYQYKAIAQHREDHEREPYAP